MKNRNIVHGRQEAQMYEAYYRSSFNLVRFSKSILAVLLFGRSAAAPSYASLRKKSMK